MYRVIVFFFLLLSLNETLAQVNGNFKNIRLTTGVTADDTTTYATNGQLYFNHNTQTLRLRKGAAWSSVLSGASNGLTASKGVARLGGALTANTLITTTGFRLRIGDQNTFYPLFEMNGGGAGNPGYFSLTAGGYFADFTGQVNITNSGNYSQVSTGSTSTSFFIQSRESGNVNQSTSLTLTNGTNGIITLRKVQNFGSSNPPNTTVLPAVSIQRHFVSGFPQSVAGDGFGTQLQFSLMGGGPNPVATTAGITYQFTDATKDSEDTKYIFSSRVNGAETNIFEINNGNILLGGSTLSASSRTITTTGSASEVGFNINTRRNNNDLGGLSMHISNSTGENSALFVGGTETPNKSSLRFRFNDAANGITITSVVDQGTQAAANLIIRPASAGSGGTSSSLTLEGGQGTGTGNGGNVLIRAGTVSGTGANGFVVMNNLPTGCAGAPSGALWNDSGTLKICP